MRNVVLSLLAVSLLWAGGCISVARMPNGELAPVIPVGGEVAESNWTRIGNAAASAAPYADLILPGLGTSLAATLAALGYGTYRGRRNTEEKYKTADEWFKEGLSMPQVQVVNATPSTQGAPNGQ